MVPDSNPLQEISFAAAEYRAFWKEWGLEEEVRIGTARAIPKALSPSPTPPAPSSAPQASLDAVRGELGDCKRCGLCETRKQIIFGVGSPHAKLLFIGEGPGVEEDTEGVPFAARSGELLTKIIEAMGLPPEAVYLTNIVKCHAPQNRAPTPEETGQCLPFLRKQIEAIQPSVIVTLGATATSALLGDSSSLSTLRGHYHGLPWRSDIPVMPTYHPTYLLRNPASKRAVWDDMKLVMAKLGHSR